MNIWIKHVCLVVAPCIIIACSTAQKNRKNNPNAGPFKKLDSLSVTIIKPEIDPSDSIAQIDTTSSIFIESKYLYSLKNVPEVSERMNNISEYEELLKNKVFTHIDILVLKLSIDAYRNINYLKQDF
jgi:hypothetical protein